MSQLYILSNHHSVSELNNELFSDAESLLLIADGVLASLNNTFKESKKIIYALKPDCDSRGITSNIPSYIQLISDDEMVDLCNKAEQIVSW